MRNHRHIVFYVHTQHTHGALSRWEPSTHQLLTGGGGGGEGRWLYEKRPTPRRGANSHQNTISNTYQTPKTQQAIT